MIDMQMNKIEEEKLSFHINSHKNNHWENIRINFLASSRTDMEFGIARLESTIKS